LIQFVLYHGIKISVNKIKMVKLIKLKS